MGRRKKKWRKILGMGTEGDNVIVTPTKQETKTYGKQSEWQAEKTRQATFKRQWRRADQLQIGWTPSAFAKLMWFVHRGDHEVGGYGLCVNPKRGLLIEQLNVLPQECGKASIDFTDEGVAEYMDRFHEDGFSSEEAMAVWVHSHPWKGKPTPSGTDRDTFNALSRMPWSVMMIVSLDAQFYCEMRLNVGPGLTVYPHVGIDWSAPWDGVNDTEWEEEYQEKIRIKSYTAPKAYEFNTGKAYAGYNGGRNNKQGIGFVPQTQHVSSVPFDDEGEIIDLADDDADIIARTNAAGLAFPGAEVDTDLILGEDVRDLEKEDDEETKRWIEALKRDGR